MASSVPAELLKQLSVASEALNNVSDTFNQQIDVIEEALASYNLGVTAWVTAHSENDYDYDDGGQPIERFTRDINVGYQKNRGKWCLMAALSISEFQIWEEWPLRDAPRERRLQAIDGIPRLLEKLISEANTLAEQISKKTVEARVLATSIKPRKEQRNAKN